MKRALVISGSILALAALAATQSQFFSGDLIVGGSVKDPSGAFWIKDAPLTNSVYARSNGVWVPFTPGGGGGISHGPSDGFARGSRNGSWDIIDTSDLANFASWAESFVAQSSASGGRSVLGLGNSATRDVGTGSGDVAQGDHAHAWADITSKPDVATNGHAHAASDITSGELGTARLGSGSPTTNTFLRGRSGGGAEWSTLPGGSTATNGVPEAPSDGVNYGRKNGAWVGLDIVDVAGVTGFGESLVGAVDEVDALGLLALTGGGAATIDSPAKYPVRANSGGSASTRHRLNLIGGSGITVSLSDDGANDESDATFTIGSHAHDWADITGEPSFAETSRAISTANSLTGGGDLSANRTLSLVGDSASPGNSKYYGTDGSGSRGFHALPSGDVAFAVASFYDAGSPGTPSACTMVSGSSSGVYGVYREEDGLYRVDLLSTQPSGSFKRATPAQIATGYLAYTINVMSNATFRSTGTNVFVYVTAAGGVSNFETNNPVMIRIYNH